MDKFLSNLPENLKFSINETISIFILILTIMLITKISIKKKMDHRRTIRDIQRSDCVS